MHDMGTSGGRTKVGSFPGLPSVQFLDCLYSMPKRKKA